MTQCTCTEDRDSDRETEKVILVLEDKTKHLKIFNCQNIIIIEKLDHIFSCYN